MKKVRMNVFVLEFFIENMLQIRYNVNNKVRKCLLVTILWYASHEAQHFPEHHRPSNMILE